MFPGLNQSTKPHFPAYVHGIRELQGASMKQLVREVEKTSYDERFFFS
jgi:hypothetical protein